MRHLLHKSLITLLVIHLTSTLCAQQIYNFGLNNGYGFERTFNDSNSVVFPDLMTKNHIGFPDTSYHNFLVSKAFYQHWFEVDTDGFYLSIDPILIMNSGINTADSLKRRNWTNGRGIIANLKIGKRVTVMSQINEYQSVLPYYLDTFSRFYDIVPGSGRIKPFKEEGVDYNFVHGLVHLNLSNWLNVSFGNYKHFVGVGYRSMLLSDVSHSYPFVKWNLKPSNSCFEYSHLISQYSSLFRSPNFSTPESPFITKGGNHHIMSFNWENKINLLIYDATIVQQWDTNGTVHNTWEQWSPIPMIGFIMGDSTGRNLNFIGTQLVFNPGNKTRIYGQYVFDNNFSYGLQAGIAKKWNVLSCIINTRFEYNKASDLMYLNSKWGIQNYSHYNQSLAHPVGNGFSEFMFMMDMSLNRWQIQMSLNEITKMEQSHDISLFTNNSNVGGTYPDFYQDLSAVENLSVYLNFMINPEIKLELTSGIQIRNQKRESMNSKEYIYVFGIRTGIQGLYSDF